MIVTLEAGEAWSTVVGAEGLLVRVAGGEVWLTREGDPDDHVLAAPHALRSERRGRLAVQALGPARLEVSPLRRGAALGSPAHPEPDEGSAGGAARREQPLPATPR